MLFDIFGLSIILQTMKDCIFCKIAKKEMPSEIVGRTKNVIAFKNINPVSSYHVLITPKDHIESFMHITPSKKDIYFEMTKLAQKLIKENKLEDGYKLVFNGGKYQQVKHVHWHLLGGELKDKNDILNRT